MLLFLAALIGETVAAFRAPLLFDVVAQRCLADMRGAVFAHVQRLPMSYFDRNPIGRLVTRLTSDVDVLNEMFAAGAMTICCPCSPWWCIVTIMVELNGASPLVARAPAGAVRRINFFRLAARRNYRQIRERIARLNAYLQEAMSGMMIIQLFARESKPSRVRRAERRPSRG